MRMVFTPTRKIIQGVSSDIELILVFLIEVKIKMSSFKNNSNK